MEIQAQINYLVKNVESLEIKINQIELNLEDYTGSFDKIEDMMTQILSINQEMLQRIGQQEDRIENLYEIVHQNTSIIHQNTAVIEQNTETIRQLTDYLRQPPRNGGN